MRRGVCTLGRSRDLHAETRPRSQFDVLLVRYRARDSDADITFHRGIVIRKPGAGRGRRLHIEVRDLCSA
jgi:hypothetical protein